MSSVTASVTVGGRRGRSLARAPGGPGLPVTVVWPPAVPTSSFNSTGARAPGGSRSLRLRLAIANGGRVTVTVQSRAVAYLRHGGGPWWPLAHSLRGAWWFSLVSHTQLETSG